MLFLLVFLCMNGRTIDAFRCLLNKFYLICKILSSGFARAFADFLIFFENFINTLSTDNKHPPAEPVVFHFRAVSPNTTSGAQAALMTTWQSCDCYLPPVNGPFLCLTFFSYAFAPLFVPYFPVYFSILAFSSFFALFLIAFSFALFCSSAKPLLNPRTIRGFSYTKICGGHFRARRLNTCALPLYSGMEPFKPYFTR